MTPPTALLLLGLLAPLASVSANPCLAANTCTECIKADSQCAWCLDPVYNVSRCNYKSELQQTCTLRSIYSPLTELRVAKQHNVPIGKKHPDGVTYTQLEPQQVQVRIKPGDFVEVPFKYEHHKRPGVEVQNFQVMTSNIENTGVKVEFSIDCNGERIQGVTCPGLQEGQRVNFFARISLTDCKDVALSVSVYGYNTVSAVFVTPLCSCECESIRFHDRRSAHCRGAGDLVCGVCQCQPGKGGRSCECDLQQYGVSSAGALEDQCRFEPGQAVCSGAGSCECGSCRCHNPGALGKYCECDNSRCPVGSNGQVCSGQGSCNCGKCQCESGFEGANCGCKAQPEACIEHGITCSGNGACECGRCVCNDGYGGEFCSLSTSAEDDQRVLGVSNDDQGQILPSSDEASRDEFPAPEPEAAAASALLPTLSLMVAVVRLLL